MEKVSHGLILTRYGEKGIEFLLVHRRTTYAFSDIVLGHYPRSMPDSQVAQYLVDMTMDELLALYTLDYTVMWRRIFTDYPVDIKKKKKFMSNFQLRIRSIMKGIEPTGRPVWEPPKGRRLSNEEDHQCAVREFMEETNIGLESYQIIPGSIVTSWTARNRVYKVIYYVALARDSLRLRSAVVDACRAGEVDECRWFRISELNGLWMANVDRIRSFIRPALRMVKKITPSVKLCGERAEKVVNDAVVLDPAIISSRLLAGS